MRKTALFAALAIALAAILDALPADAQTATYTTVSAATGLVPSPGPCGRISNPCRTFQEALAVTAAGGVIDALTPGDYGPLAITKPISIQGHGFASITPSTGANAVTINASGGDVNLNGLLIEGAGGGADGILVTTAQAVTIANCVVRNFAHNGIEDEAQSFLVIVNTIASDNGNGNSFSGIYIHNAVSTLATLTGVTATGNGANGIVAGGAGPSVTIFSSNASNNVSDGILAQNSASVVVRDTVAANNETAGFEAASSGQLTLAHSVSHDNNGMGIYVNAGTVYSYGDNHITDGVSGATTPISPK
jgi:hypothetical protein